jgi:hypothetical protein
MLRRRAMGEGVATATPTIAVVFAATATSLGESFGDGRCGRAIQRGLAQ